MVMSDERSGCQKVRWEFKKLAKDRPPQPHELHSWGGWRGGVHTAQALLILATAAKH
jgi:hypothetical protein